MAGNLIFGHEEAAFLRELIRQKVRFIVVGLSAAALQGAPVVTQDVDLWFRDLGDPGIKRALKKVGGIYIPAMGLNPPMFAGDAVKLFDIVVHMHGLGDFDEEIKHTLRAPLGRCRIPVLKLERILKSKEATGRDKDRRVLSVLRHAIIAASGAQGAGKRPHKGNRGKD